MARHVRLINIGYPPFTGGAQTYVHLLAGSLAAHGDLPEVFTTTAGEVEAIWDSHKRSLPAGLSQVEGVPVHRVPLRHLPPAPYGYYAARRLTVALAQAPGVPPTVLWRLANFTPWLPGLPAELDGAPGPVDLVHGFTIPFEPLLRAGRDHARARNAPFVVTPFLHSGESHDPSVERGYAMPHQLGLLREADAVVALTSIERDFLLRRGLQPERVHVIPAGIPVDAAALAGPVPPPAEPPTVLFLGAATHDKGAVHLIQAVRLLEAQGVAVRLVIAGQVTGQFQQAVAREPSLDRSRIEVLGLAPAGEKERLLRECTALAMPSRVDSFGLVYLEAWAAGRPVIGARAGGVPAVIDHEENGLLVPFGDVPAIAAAIRRVVERPDEAAAMGLAGREKLRRCYTWDAVYPQVSDLYDRLLRR